MITPRRLPYWLTLIMLNATLGLIRLIESPNRTQSPAYHYAKQVMPQPAPMRWWGALFLAAATVILIAYRSTTATRIAASLGCGVWTFWAVLLAATAWTDGRSSYAGVVVYAAGAIRHYQVVRGDRCGG